MVGVAMMVLAATMTVGQMNERLALAGLLERLPGKAAATVTERDLVKLGWEFGLLLTSKTPTKAATEELCQRVLDLGLGFNKPPQPHPYTGPNTRGKGKKKGHHKSQSDPRDGM